MRYFNYQLLCILVFVIYIGLLYRRDSLIFYSRIKCTKTPAHLGLTYKTISIAGNKVWQTYHNNHATERRPDHLFVIVPGAGSPKHCSIPLLRDMIKINTCSDFLLLEYPGIGETYGFEAPSRRSSEKFLVKVHEWTLSTAYHRVTYIVNCVGCIFFLKAVAHLLDATRHAFIIVNGFVNWYRQPVNLPRLFSQGLGSVLSVIVPHQIRSELNACQELKDLKTRGVPIICFQSAFNRHVQVQHGQEIESIIGIDNYYEFPKNMQSHLDMEDSQLVKRLVTFCRFIT